MATRTNKYVYDVKLYSDMESWPHEGEIKAPWKAEFIKKAIAKYRTDMKKLYNVYMDDGTGRLIPLKMELYYDYNYHQYICVHDGMKSRALGTGQLVTPGYGSGKHYITQGNSRSINDRIRIGSEKAAYKLAYELAKKDALLTVGPSPRVIDGFMAVKFIKYGKTNICIADVDGAGTYMKVKSDGSLGVVPIAVMAYIDKKGGLKRA